MSHATHEMHANSLSAYAGLELADRSRAIFNVYATSAVPLSDREVMERLGRHDMNEIRPRVSEMVRAGVLTEVRSVPCSVTGRKVRVVTIAAPAQQTLFT